VLAATLAPVVHWDRESGDETRSVRGFLTGAFALVLLVALAGCQWAARSVTPAATSSPAMAPSGQPAATPSAPSFAVYPVNPSGSSVDDARCVIPTLNYGQAQPDWGEGYFIGARYYVNFTGQAEVHVAAISALVASDCAIYVRIVPVSSAAGRSLQEQITNDAASLRLAGVEVYLVGFDPVSDRVRIGVGSLTPQVQAALDDRYPPQMIEVYEQAPAFSVAS